MSKHQHGLIRFRKLVKVEGVCICKFFLYKIPDWLGRTKLTWVYSQKYCSTEMAVEEQESGAVQWSRRIFEFEPYEYHGNMAQDYEIDIYHGQYFTDHHDTECNHVENDEIIARTLQEEFSQLAIAEASQYSHSEENLQGSNHNPDWNSLSRRNYSSGILETCCVVPLLPMLILIIYYTMSRT